MARRGMASAATLEDIDNFFSLKPPSSTTSASIGDDGIIWKRSDDRLSGRSVDSHGNVIGPHSFKTIPGPANYKARERMRFARGTDYVEKFKAAQENDVKAQMRELALDDVATIERLETRSMTSTTMSSMDSSCYPYEMDSKMSYRGYRQGIYDDSLPITRHRNKIVSTVEATSCTIIQGMTGCGKTTQVPQYILDHYASQSRYCKIAVTQPRRIAAISIARRVCIERGWSEGTYCGYQVARDTQYDTEKTMITYMTTGILLQKIINDKNLNSYTHIILDEVHERDQDTDLALLIVKKFLKSVSPNVKIILMSATFDCEIFAEYFSTLIRGTMNHAPVINVEGRMHKVHEIYWSDRHMINLQSIPRFEESEPKVYPEALHMVVKLLYDFDEQESRQSQEENAAGKPIERGTVLVFLPGYSDIQDLSVMIENDEGLKERKLLIRPLHSTITLEEQSKVFEKPHPLYRKVILSTNIAESSITVPDIKYVVDFCLTKCLSTDRDTNMTCLKLEWASKANCKQRMGRAGRVSNGRVYKLVPKEFYVNHMQEYGEPEIRRCPLAQLILKVKKLGPEEPRALLALALSPPDVEDIRKAILLLKEAGALADSDEVSCYNPYDGLLTFVGNVLSSLPLDIQLGKLLVFGFVLGVLPECLIVAATMHTRSIFKQPFNEAARIDAFSYKLKWDRGYHSDPIATVIAYKEWDRLRESEYFERGRNAEAKWCNDHFLQRKTLHEVRDVITDLTKRLEQHNLSPKISRIPPHLRRDKEADHVTENLMLKVALSCAFYPHYFTHQTLDEAEAVKQLSGKSPLNTLYMRGLPNNQGILYKTQVEDLIKNYLPDCKIHLGFENTRCYIEFSHSAGDCGRIPNAMYTALKLSQLREKMTIRLFDEMQVHAIMEKISVLRQDTAVREKRLPTNRMYFGSDGPSVNEPKASSPPTAMISAVLYHVVHVVECGHFYAHDMDAEVYNRRNILHDKLNSPAYIQQAVPLMNPNKGMVCVAPYEGEWYRARVDELYGDSVKVFFVDYGNEEVIPISHVKTLLPELSSLPFQAVECKLAFVGPPRESENGLFPPAINQVFANMFMDKQFLCHIYSVDRGVLRFDKVVDAKSPNVRVHDILYTNGMAEKVSEPFSSEQNHKDRLRQLPHTGDHNSAWGVELDEDLSSLKQTRRRQNIIGPFSPIEMKFYNMTNVGNMKEVRVDPASINSVALDEAPDDKHDRLMVAACTSLNPQGNKVIARETTLMPNIAGLPAIVCLLFAPTVQIRTNNQRTEYTSALCGLGKDNTGMPIFPDHDIEIEFDTVIDLDDFEMINNIKMRLNYILGGTQCTVDDSSLAKFQKNIREQILKLLHKKRSSTEKKYSPERLVWLDYDPDDLMLHHLEGTAANVLHLFRLVNPPKLDCQDGHTQAHSPDPVSNLKEHCRMLTRIAASSGCDDELNLICQLCHTELRSVRQLKQHVDGRLHRQNEQKLFNLTS